MFTRRPIPQIPPGDVDALAKAVVDYLRGFNDKNALTINEAEITASQGIKFPATQVLSTDVNTLDDYEEGSWTPGLTFATPGDVNVVFSRQSGDYIKIGRNVWLTFHIVTSTFTWTTSAGALSITGGPFAASSDANYRVTGGMEFNGFTKAGYTQFAPYMVAGSATITISTSGQGVGIGDLIAINTTSATNLTLRGSISFRV